MPKNSTQMEPARMWTEPCLDARDWARYTYEAELHELVRRHGFDPADVRWVEYDVLDIPLLRIFVYRTDEHGRRYLGCDHPRFQPGDLVDDGCGQPCVAHDIVETALVGGLPSWWKPQAA